jgi:hypothetical protein
MSYTLWWEIIVSKVQLINFNSNFRLNFKGNKIKMVNKVTLVFKYILQIHDSNYVRIFRFSIPGI